MNTPRGPLFLGRDDSPDTAKLDVSDNYGMAMAAWRDSARQEAYRTAQLGQEYGEVTRYIEVVSGKHWEANRRKYRSHFVTNRVGKARFDNLSLLTDVRPTIDIGVADKTLQPAADLLHLVTAAEYGNNDVDLKTVRVSDIAMLTGDAFWRMGASSPGVTNITELGPDSVMPIQPGFSIQSSAAVLHETWKSIAQLKSKWGRRADGIEREASMTSSQSGTGTSTYANPGTFDQYTWNGLAPQMQRLLGRRLPTQSQGGGLSNSFGTVQWQEFWIDDPSINESRNKVLMKHPGLTTEQHNYWYWVNPGEPLYPRKRLVCYAGTRLMYDGPSPFWHGMYPFPHLQFNPVFWSFWGLSAYRDLLPLNSAINEVIAGILDMIKRILNPVSVTKEGGVPAAAWRDFYPDRPGAKLRMNPMANPQTDLRYMDKPDIPGWVFQVLSQFLGPEFDKLAGLLDINEMGRKNQVPGGDTIDTMKDTMQTAIRLRGRFLEAFLRDAGTMQVSNIIQFYTLKTRMRMLGGKGVSSFDFDYDPGNLWPGAYSKNRNGNGSPMFDHWKRFAFRVEPGSMHSASSDRLYQRELNEFQLGANSMQSLWRSRKKSDPERTIAEMIDEAQQKAKFAAAMAPQEPPDPKLVEAQNESRKLDQIDKAVQQIQQTMPGVGQPQQVPAGQLNGM